MPVYEPSNDGRLYGLHIPYDQGYDAQSKGGKKGLRAEKTGASGKLTSWDGGDTIALWITDVLADFSLSGQTGQSRMVREFYPRNLNDVIIQIIGNVANTYEYNRLAAFVREHQWKALDRVNRGVSGGQTIQFDLYNTYGANQTPSAGRGRVKGSHRPWTMIGYIRTMTAGAVQHEVAPQFTIDFIVTEAKSGFWTDGPMFGGDVLPSFLQLLNIANGGDRLQGQGSGFIQDPVVGNIGSSLSGISASTGLAAVNTIAQPGVNTIISTAQQLFGNLGF